MPGLLFQHCGTCTGHASPTRTSILARPSAATRGQQRGPPLCARRRVTACKKHVKLSRTCAPSPAPHAHVCARCAQDAFHDSSRPTAECRPDAFCFLTQRSKRLTSPKNRRIKCKRRQRLLYVPAGADPRRLVELTRCA